MGDLVSEKLTQKVSNMLDEIGDVNILIRRLTPTQETLNRINERVDAVFGALKQLEKGVQLDEQKLAQLEMQIALLKEGLETVNKTAEGLVSSFDNTARGLKASVQGIEVKVNQLGDLTKGFGERSDGIRKRLDALGQELDTHGHEESERWENNKKVIGELQGRLVDLKVIGVVTIVLVVMILSFVLFRGC